MQMSRNFELLSRARGAEALFPPVMGNGSLENSSVQRQADAIQNEVVEINKTDVRLPELAWDGREREELVKLVRRVFAFPNSHAPRAVTFASVEGNASSEFCFRVGAVLAAQASASVCLVDANLHAPSLCLLSGVAPSPGLFDATMRPESIIDFPVRIAGTNLWVVPPGSAPNTIQSAFLSDRLRARFAELRGIFDYVLVDAPLITSPGDAVLLGQMADGVILIIEAHSTRRETARTAKDTFERANVKLLGAILNNRTFPIPEALYRKL
jgi:Mrp family chromosome partitioning ATPase